MNARAIHACCVPIFVTLLATGCNSRPEPAPNALEQLASAHPTLMGARPAAQEPRATTPPARTIRHPDGEADLVLTDQRRAQIERAFPEARGFVPLSELEANLQKSGLRRGKDERAQRAFDKLARGKWVLFTGNLMNPNADSFSVPVRYTSRDPSDRLGLTSTWFPVELRDIKGYDHSQHEPGELLAILARYNGAGAAAPGYDLVLLDKWFVEDSRAAR